MSRAPLVLCQMNDEKLASKPLSRDIVRRSSNHSPPTTTTTTTTTTTATSASQELTLRDLVIDKSMKPSMELSSASIDSVTAMSGSRTSVVNELSDLRLGLLSAKKESSTRSVMGDTDRGVGGDGKGLSTSLHMGKFDRSRKPLHRDASTRAFADNDPSYQLSQFESVDYR